MCETTDNQVRSILPRFHMSNVATVDGIPVVRLSSAAETAADVDTKPLETAQDAVGPAQSRFRLRMSAIWWRSLQYVGMTMHYLAPPRPPNPSFTKTIPSTISETKGEFTLQFYTPEGYDTAPKTGRKFPAVINFHGGGFVLGSGTDDARFAQFVLDHCSSVFISVDYRLSPEYPFPVPVDDAADAILFVIRFAHDLYIDRDKLAISGFSAGGNLALTSTLRLKDHLQSLSKASNSIEIPPHRIRALATWYPLTDYTIPRPLKRARSKRPDQTLPPTLTSLFDASYLYPPSLPLSNPYLSPSKATDAQLAAALPETMIFYTCEWDMLLQEGEGLANRIKSEPIGKDVRYKMVKAVAHAWDKSPDPMKVAEGSEEVYKECCAVLRAAFERE